MPFFYAKLFHFKNGANNSVLMDNEMNFLAVNKISKNSILAFKYRFLPVTEHWLAIISSAEYAVTIVLKRFCRWIYLHSELSYVYRQNSIQLLSN